MSNKQHIQVTWIAGVWLAGVHKIGSPWQGLLQAEVISAEWTSMVYIHWPSRGDDSATISGRCLTISVGTKPLQVQLLCTTP